MPISKINAIWLHDIDQTKGSSKRLPFTDKEDVADFVEKFVEKATATKRKRTYLFPRDTVETRTLILRIAKDKADEKAADALAELLASVEKDARSKYGHFQTIQEGNLLQVYFENAETNFCFMAKVDLLKVLDRSSLKYRDGLPVEKYMMKACLVKLNGHIDCGEIWVGDSNSQIASYWSADFLGLQAVRDDTINTKDAFDAMEKLIIKKVKPQSPTDYRSLRKGILGYMKTNADIVYEDLISTVFGSYSPENDQIDMKSLIEQLIQLPEKHGFDTQFTVDPKQIAKKREYQVPLTNHLDLTVKDEDAIAGSVKAVKDAGRKAIQIYTETGYDYFSAKTKK